LLFTLWMVSVCDRKRFYRNRATFHAQAGRASVYWALPWAIVTVYCSGTLSSAS